MSDQEEFCLPKAVGKSNNKSFALVIPECWSGVGWAFPKDPMQSVWGPDPIRPTRRPSISHNRGLRMVPKIYQSDEPFWRDEDAGLLADKSA